MKNKQILYIIALILCLSLIIITKFILITHYGWLETIIFILSIIISLYSVIKLCQLSLINKIIKIILIIIFVIIILWFSLLSIEYKRHKNLYQPLFNGFGFNVIEDYDMDIQTGRIYKSSSKFYIFNKKISEVYVIEN